MIFPKILKKSNSKRTLSIEYSSNIAIDVLKKWSFTILHIKEATYTLLMGFLNISYALYEWPKTNIVPLKLQK